MKYDNYKVLVKGDTYLVVEENKIIHTTILESEADRLCAALQNGAAFRGKTPNFMTLGNISQISI